MPDLEPLPVALLAQARDGGGQLVAPRRRIADPERQRRRRAVRVLDEDLVDLDLLHLVRRIAELEDVARHALEGEVLADAADAVTLGVQHHVVVELVRDHAAVGHGREPRAAARAQAPVHRVVVQVGRAPAATRGVAVGEHRAGPARSPGGQVRVGLRAAKAGEEFFHAPFAAGDFRDDLLRQHIEGLLRHADPVELAAPHAIEQGGALDEVVEREREQPPLRDRADRMARAADALQERGDPARRAHLADEVDVADVDAEFEGRGRDQRLQRGRP